MIMFVQLQFDQEARRAMILQLGNFKGNVTWFLFFEYLIDLNAVISKAMEHCQSTTEESSVKCSFVVFVVVIIVILECCRRRNLKTNIRVKELLLEQFMTADREWLLGCVSEP